MTQSNEKAPRLERLNLIVTKYCNLHCRMCDVTVWYRRFKNRSLENLQALIQEAAALGAKEIELSGGEPMTRKDIYEIIAYANSLGLKVTMVSNGVLIGPLEVEKLISTGLSSISFSLEGPEALNDQIRGRGNFQKALNAIQGFLKVQPDSRAIHVEVSITLSKFNYSTIVPFSKYLMEEIGVRSIAVNPFSPGFLLPKNQKSRGREFQVTEELIPDLTRVMAELIEYGKASPGKLPAASYLSKIPDYFMGKKLIPAGGCQVPMSYCGITMNGYVFSCWQNPPLGNLEKASLTQIMNSEIQRKQIEQALAGKCPGCLSSCYAEIH